MFTPSSGSHGLSPWKGSPPWRLWITMCRWVRACVGAWVGQEAGSWTGSELRVSHQPYEHFRVLRQRVQRCCRADGAVPACLPSRPRCAALQHKFFVPGGQVGAARRLCPALPPQVEVCAPCTIMPTTHSHTACACHHLTPAGWCVRRGSASPLPCPNTVSAQTLLPGRCHSLSAAGHAPLPLHQPDGVRRAAGQSDRAGGGGEAAAVPGGGPGRAQRAARQDGNRDLVDFRMLTSNAALVSRVQHLTQHLQISFTVDDSSNAGHINHTPTNVWHHASRAVRSPRALQGLCWVPPAACSLHLLHKHATGCFGFPTPRPDWIACTIDNTSSHCCRSSEYSACSRLRRSASACCPSTLSRSASLAPPLPPLPPPPALHGRSASERLAVAVVPPAAALPLPPGSHVRLGWPVAPPGGELPLGWLELRLRQREVAAW